MPFVSLTRAAEMLGVDRRTVQRWSDEGILPVAHTTRGGHSRYLLQDVEQLLAAPHLPRLRHMLEAPSEDLNPLPDHTSAQGVVARSALHPFVRSVAEFFDSYPGPSDSVGVRGSGFVTIKVSPSLRERAFLLADAILTSLLDRGHEVVASRTGVDVLVSGAAFELLVKDLLPKVRTSPPTWDLAFTFRFEKRNVGTWRETDLSPATGFIPEAIATIEALAPTARPIQEERIRVAAAARLAKEEEKRARQRLRQRLANRPKYILWLVLQLNDARMLQALAEYLDDGGAHPRIRQLRDDICTLAGRLMASLALDEVEAELKLFDLYDEAPGDETMPAP